MAAVGVLLLVCAVVALVTAGGVAWYRHRAAHAVALAGPGAWAAACVDADRPRAWRVLVIDGDGVHLRRTSGREEQTWAWPEVASASAASVLPVASVIAHRGLHLALADGSSAEFLFPSASTLRYPPELLAAAMSELARHGKAAGSQGGDLAG